MKQEGNFELTSQTFVGLENLSFGNSQATNFQSFVGDCIRNLYIELNDVVLRYTIAAREQVLLARA
jgi:hypothetical protein